MKNFKKQGTFKPVCAFILAFMLIMTNLTGLVEVKAAGVPAPTIDKVFYDATEISGAGVHRARVGGKTVRGTIHVTLKNGNTTKASSVINSTTTKWLYKLPEGVSVAEGDIVTAYQEFNGSNSDTVTANAEPSYASTYKSSLKMPSGDFYLEQYSSNIVSEDEKAEALQMLKDANPSFSDKIESVEFSIKGIEEGKKAYYVVNYTDKSKSEEIVATNLKIVKVIEYSRRYTVEPYNVVSTVIKGKLDGEGPFNNIKVQFSAKLGESDKANFCKGGKCTIDKNSTNFQTIDVNPQTGEFSIDVGENTLEIGAILGITIKEPHKFVSCNSSVTKMAMPKVDVKDPKKLKPEEKVKIADAIRKANTTPGGKSKLPDGNEYTGGIPAVIQIDDSGNVKIFSGSDVKGDWDDNYKFVPETNEDGSYKLKDGTESKVTFDKPEELLSNLPPDTPKMENKDGNVVVTPNIEVDTDAKSVVVEYEGTDGSKKKITATKTDTGWTVDNDKAKVDENGVVSFPAKEVKPESKVEAYVVDNGGLVASEPAENSGKAELKIENKYKIVYDKGEGSGTMEEKEVNVGTKYTILKSEFTPPQDKEFDHWMIGFEPKKQGEEIEVNNDVVIKAIYKYIINPTASEIETVVGHPVNYKMYKDAIKDFPTALTVEHIKVVTPPDISKVGGTQAEIEVRFSDGQFRTIPVTVNVKPDPKDKEIEKLNKDIENLNKQITDLNNTITEKDTKITELNGKIADLEEQLKTCQEQCAKDKAQCEKDKQALRDQIAELEKAKSSLEIQVKENRELIEQLRKQIASLEKQVEDWKKIAGEKDAKIKELENNIKDLNTKLETANTANIELKERLATATEKITGLENKIKDLENKVEELNNKVTELNKTIEAKDAEIKTLNETITTLKENIVKLEAEKTKDKEAYDKEKANLEKQVQEAKDALATKEKEIGNVKTELEQVKNDLSTEKAKTAGLEEQVKAKDEMITKLNKDIEELKAQLAKAKDGNTTIIKEKETIIKEKETLIEKLTSEKAELEKQLVAEKAKNENLEKQITDLNVKVDKANKDLNKANTDISNLEKELAAEKAKNAEIMKQLEKLGKDLETKINEVNTLTNKVNELENQITKQKTKSEADAKEIERLTKELEDLKAQLANKDSEVKNLNGEISTLKETVKTLEGEKTELTNNVTKLETEVKELKDKLETTNNKVIELEKENAALKAENKNLTDKVADLTEKVKKAEDENVTLKTKIDELNAQIAKLSKSQCDPEEFNRLKQEKAALETKLEGKDELIQELRNQIAELKKSLTDKDTEYKEKIKELEEKSNTLTNENAGLKEQFANANERIKNLEALLETEKEKNKENADKIKELEEAKKSLEEEKTTLEGKVTKLEEDIKAIETEKEKLAKNKADLEAEIERLRAELEAKDKDETDKAKLQEKIAELEALIKKQKQDIEEKDRIIKELTEKKDNTCKDASEAEKKIKELEDIIKDLEDKIKEKDNQYNKDREAWKKEKDKYEFNNRGYIWINDDNRYLENKNEKLEKENKELEAKVDELSKKKEVVINNKENYVTIFSLDSMLYKSYLGIEFITQAEMTDFNGYIRPFISNSRTMLPIRYVALSLGLDVKWDNTTRTATFINNGLNNVLKPGVITINADTLVMKDGVGNVIPVDSQPILKDGRFYVSITNLTKAFGGTNGDLYDGVKNTIEWDQAGKRVLVYKYIR